MNSVDSENATEADKLRTLENVDIELSPGVSNVHVAGEHVAGEHVAGEHVTGETEREHDPDQGQAEEDQTDLLTKTETSNSDSDSADVDVDVEPPKLWFILPPMFLWIVSGALLGPALSPYIVEIVKQYHPGLKEVAIQSLAARWDLSLRLADNVIVFLLIPVYGEFSNKYGRTNMLALHSTLKALSDLAYCVLVAYKTPIYTLVIPHILSGLSGQWPVLLALCFSFASDITKRNKAQSFIKVEAVQFAGNTFSPMIGGFLYTYVATWLPFLLSALGTAIAAIIFKVIPESLSPKKRLSRIRYKKAIPHTSVGVLCETRHRVFLSLAVVFGYSSYGLNYVLSFYTIFMFQWTGFQIGLLWTAMWLANTLFVAYGINLIKKIFNPKWHMMFALRVCVISYCITMFFFYISKVAWTFYLIRLFGGLAAGTLVTTRTMLTDSVHPDKQQQVQSAVGLLEAFLNMFIGPIYESIYSATVGSFPQACFAVGDAMSFIAFCLSLFIKKELLKDYKQGGTGVKGQWSTIEAIEPEFVEDELTQRQDKK